MPRTTEEAPAALEASRIVLSSEDALLLERLCEMMQRTDVATVRAAAVLAASVLAESRRTALERP